jgi:alanine racemase
MIRTAITLSKFAFYHNIAHLVGLTRAPVMALVVKSNAYGHGMLEIAMLAESHPAIGWLCTAGIHEALTLRSKGIKKPIIVLSYLDGSLEEALKHDLHLVAASFEDAQAISVAAQAIYKTACIHVKVDTGMGRLGIIADQAVPVIHEMTKLPFISVYGVFTHLSNTGHADHAHSYKQLARFDELLDDLKVANIAINCTHALSSSSLHLVPKRTYSFMRVGAAAYGLWKHPLQIQLVQEAHPDFSLAPILQWKARIIAIKNLNSGSPVGYQLSFTTTRPSRIALVPIGYWDGYPHALSNKGKALLHGQIVPVAGIVSMNLAAFDVTDVPDSKVGDELLLIADASGVRPYEVAHAAGCITNVLMTTIPSSIERTIVDEHQSIISTQSLSPQDSIAP